MNEPAMTCEEAQIALEKRLRGALEPDVETSLEEHLARCESCPTYERDARGIDAALRTAVTDVTPAAWRGVRRRVLIRRYGDLAWRVVFGALLVWIFLAGLLERIARSSSAYPSRDYFPFEVFIALAVAGGFAWGGWVRAKEAREATFPDYLQHLYQADLVRRIRLIRRWWWLWSAYVLLNLIAVPSGRPGSAIARGLVALLLLPAAWSRFVTLPRLEREEQDLPFFDDFPHIV